MGFREQWGDLGTGGKILVGVAVAGVMFIVGLVLLVVLSAVIASFVLGLGSSADPAAAPQGSWGFDYDATNESSGELTITHEGGDSVEASKLTVAVGSRTVDWDGSGTISVGDSTTVEVGPDEVVRLVWGSGEEETVLGEWDGQRP